MADAVARAETSRQGIRVGEVLCTGVLAMAGPGIAEPSAEWRVPSAESGKPGGKPRHCPQPSTLGISTLESRWIGFPLRFSAATVDPDGGDGTIRSSAAKGLLRKSPWRLTSPSQPVETSVAASLHQGSIWNEPSVRCPLPFVQRHASGVWCCFAFLC